MNTATGAMTTFGTTEELLTWASVSAIAAVHATKKSLQIKGKQSKMDAKCPNCGRHSDYNSTWCGPCKSAYFGGVLSEREKASKSFIPRTCGCSDDGMRIQNPPMSTGWNVPALALPCTITITEPGYTTVAISDSCTIALYLAQPGTYTITKSLYDPLSVSVTRTIA